MREELGCLANSGSREHRVALTFAPKVCWKKGSRVRVEYFLLQYLRHRPIVFRNLEKMVANVLCLGVSYADLWATTGNDQAAAEGIRPTTESIVAEVSAGTISEMDGRDLARCIATEDLLGVEMYAVSQEEGAKYNEGRHLNANFNAGKFVRRMEKWFSVSGSPVRFDQVVLDYYWMPTAWTLYHWKPSLFNSTLIELASRDLVLRAGRRTDLITGSVILPFSLHCYKEVLAAWSNLSKHYNLSFLRDGDDLNGVALWAGTQRIAPDTMRKFSGAAGG